MNKLEVKNNSLPSRISGLLTNINSVLIGQEQTVLLASAAFLAGGHVLLEDVPGVGKTLLAKSLAKSVSAEFKRIQCTPDLLPSDVVGVNIFDQRHSSFVFEPGPLFTNILLADEINRATPRTQSSLLEAMEEGQITVDGETRGLPELFFVIATQNSVEYHGTFPLPEAQLDRFMMSLHLGYPTNTQEIQILDKTLEEGSFEVSPILTVSDILSARHEIKQVHLEESIKKYIVDIATATRNTPEIIIGVSPRGSQLLMRACQSFAYLSGREFVKPEDVKMLAPHVFGHRISPKQRDNRINHSQLIERILTNVAVPA